MDLGIDNKRVLLVGVGNGIGKAIAKAYAKEGGVLTLLSRNESSLKLLIDELDNKNKGHSFLAADLMKDNEPKKTISGLIKNNKKYDIIVHNIGHTLNIRDPLGDLSEWEKIWKLNTGIAIEVNNLLIPAMIEQAWGRIIHISSISAKLLRGSPQYCCAKAYLNAYVTNVGRYLADKGIVMSALMPGAVEFKGSYWEEIKIKNPDKYSGYLKEHQAIGRMGKPEEIAAFAVFMGSIHVTFAPSSIIAVDGGQM